MGKILFDDFICCYDDYVVVVDDCVEFVCDCYECFVFIFVIGFVVWGFEFLLKDLLDFMICFVVYISGCFVEEYEFIVMNKCMI